MKEQDQQIAIAEWCGWKVKGTVKNYGKDTLVGWPPPPSIGEEFIPNYLHDLNAIQEAVMRLEPRKQLLFRIKLNKIVERDYNVKYGEGEYDKLAGFAKDFLQICATAAQRCEALLRTLGKWKEGE